MLVSRSTGYSICYMLAHFWILAYLKPAQSNDFVNRDYVFVIVNL